MGTRRVRTFFVGWPGPADGVVEVATAGEADARLANAVAVVVGGAGGAADSNTLTTDAGSASSACRNPVVKKFRCVSAAFRFVSKSTCSSDCCS